MSAQIVFLTLFLGIVSGHQAISLQVVGPIKTVRLTAGGQEIAVLTGPPWRTVVDFGTELTPRELTAVGLDSHGEEIARATQILNLPRPVAELDIALDYAAGKPAGVTLSWKHLMSFAPYRAKVSLDGKPLNLDRKLRAALPKLDPQMPHVIAAELRFGDDFVAKREVVIESERLSDSVGTQLTPIVVRETAAQHPPSWDGCLVRPSGKPVRIAAVEKPRALLIVVRDPDLSDIRIIARQVGSTNDLPSLEQGTMQRMLWPLGKLYRSDENPSSFLFTPSQDVPAKPERFLGFLMMHGPEVNEHEARQFASAVAAAGVSAATGVQRRAVILLLSQTSDSSSRDPGAVRRYLEAIGVPLFVWKPRADAPPAGAEKWGEIEDVSTLEKMNAATGRVRRTLEEQRIAWVDVDPLTALQLKTDERCGIEMVARSGRE